MANTITKAERAAVQARARELLATGLDSSAAVAQLMAELGISRDRARGAVGKVQRIDYGRAIHARDERARRRAVSFKLPETTIAAIEELAEHGGITATQVVIDAVMAAWARVQG